MRNDIVTGEPRPPGEGDRAILVGFQLIDSVLESLKVGSTPRIIAWNKIDPLSARLLPTVPTQSLVDSIAINAKTGENLDGLGEALVSMRLVIPYGRYDLVGLLYEQAIVEEREDAAQGIRMLVTMRKALVEKLAEFAERGLVK